MDQYSVAQAKTFLATMMPTRELSQDLIRRMRDNRY